jgi:glycogen debranching enzyme
MSENLLRMHPGQLLAHSGHLLLVTDSHGRIGRGSEGFYAHQTRFLSRLALSLDGHPLRPACATTPTAHALSAGFVARAPKGAVRAAGTAVRRLPVAAVSRQGLEVQLRARLEGGLRLTLVIVNRTPVDLEVELACRLAADYADYQKVSQGKRAGAPAETRWEDGPAGAALRLRCRDPRLAHATLIRFSGAPGWRLAADSVCCRLALPAGRPVPLGIDVEVLFGGTAPQPGSVARASLDRLRADWLAEAARMRLDQPRLQQVWDRAVADLAALALDEGDGVERLAPAAGIPGYQAVFGRDMLVTGCQSALLGPELLRGSLRLLAGRLGEKDDPRFDEQPGRVLHQQQRSPSALLGETPFLHYYGDYSAPALFLIGLASDFAWTGDGAFLDEMREPMRRVLGWIDRDADLDGDGLYEYRTRAGRQGLKNQGWKDSGEAILYPDGGCVPDPIALVEIQGAYYAAKRALGLALAAHGETAEGHALLRQARDLKRRFDAAFWLPEEEYLALALDPGKQPVRTIASDPAHCLAYGVVARDKGEAVSRRLMAPDLFTGWGLRTLSSAHPCYNPFAYHLGAVWPLSAAMAALGLKRYGRIEALHRVAEGLLAAAQLFEQDRLPEAMSGHPRDADHPHPGIYPKANAPQAWSAGAVVLVLQALLGLQPLAPFGTLVVEPTLPEWLPALTLENLRVGEARVTLRFERHPPGETSCTVLSCTGRLRVRQRRPR